MIIELTDEMMVELFNKTLVDDARMMAMSIRDLRNDLELKSKAYLQADMEDNQRFLRAMRVLISYYFTAEQANEYLSELDSILFEPEV